MARVWPVEWYTITAEALLDLWRGFINFLPELIGALLVFLVGWLVSVFLGRAVTQLLNRLKLNQFFERTGWSEAFRRADLKVDLSEFLGAIVKWVLVFAFLLAAVEILGFLQFASFLTTVLAFLPNVVVSVLIFAVAVILSDISQKVLVAGVEKAKIGYGKAIGLFVRWAIMVFALLAIMVQLGIARQMIMTLFTGLVALLVISLGLAFGLGGKEMAAETLRGLRDKLR